MDEYRDLVAHAGFHLLEANDIGPKVSKTWTIINPLLGGKLHAFGVSRNGGPESAWPINGSILVRDGLAYFSAGRNSFIDGGIYIYALDPATAEVVHRKHMFGPFDENDFPIENREVVNGSSIAGFKGNICIGGEELVYLRHQGFTPDLTPVALQDVTEAHIIPSHGFIEAIPQHRSFWTIDTMLHYDIEPPLSPGFRWGGCNRSAAEPKVAGAERRQIDNRENRIGTKWR